MSNLESLSSLIPDYLVIKPCCVQVCIHKPCCVHVVSRFAYTSHPLLLEHIDRVFKDNLAARAVIQAERRAKAAVSAANASTSASTVEPAGEYADEDMDRGRRLTEAMRREDTRKDEKTRDDDRDAGVGDMARGSTRALMSIAEGSYAEDDGNGAYGDGGPARDAFPRMRRERVIAGLTADEAGAYGGPGEVISPSPVSYTHLTLPTKRIV